jgi:hypothetical protein
MPIVEVYAIAVTHARGFDLEDRSIALIFKRHVGGADNPIVPPATRSSRGTIDKTPMTTRMSDSIGGCEAEALSSNEYGGG